MEWQKIDEKLIKDGWRKVISRTFILPDGRQQDFEIKKEGESVCVVALTNDNKVVLAKQFRPGPEKVLLELPGGGLEKGETPLEAIRRELFEETGYNGNIQFVKTVLDCAYSTRIRHCFVATECSKVQDQALDEFEIIEVQEMPLSDFREHLRGGQLTDTAVGYIGLDYLKLL